MSMDNVIAAFQRHPKFLVSSHVDSEGDALGSQLAVAALLEQMGKEVVLLDETPPPKAYQFLPGVQRIRTDIDALVGERFPAVVVVDCPTLKRIGRVAEVIAPGAEMINIDHHISNERFGDVNWVEPKAAAVGEMIYELYERTRQPLSLAAAQALYVALLVDTGSFRFSNTSSRTHQVAGALVALGCKPHQIYEALYEHVPVSTVLLLSRALATLQIEEEGRLAWFQISRPMVEESGARLEEADTFIDMVRVIQGVQVVVLLIQTAVDRVRVSFRSKGLVDVNKMASCFGGGGHVAASGCVLTGDFEEIQQRVLAKAREALSQAYQEVSC